MTRAVPALGAPPPQLGRFPAVQSPNLVWRAHGAQWRPWWFSSSLAGRFDLRPPHGTCYAASDPVAALRERLGPTLASLRFVRAADVDGVVVSFFPLPEPVELADTTATIAANFGLTREICTATDYGLTQQWAAAWHHAGFRGIRYQPRFSTAADAFAVALFGKEGLADFEDDLQPVSARTVAESAKITVVEATPSITQMERATPPSRSRLSAQALASPRRRRRLK